MKRFSPFAAIAIAAIAQQPPSFRSDVNLVQMECSVTKGGRPLLDMRLEDFVLLDNGSPRTIEHLWKDTDLPLTVGLIVDVSGSQARFVDQHRQSVAQFLQQVLSPHDQAFLVTVADDVRLVTDFTSSVGELRRGVDEIGKTPSPGAVLGDCLGPPRKLAGRYFPDFCSTALWNGIYFAALRKMASVGGRKTLVVLTDGIDQTSPHSLDEAIGAAQSTDSRVYAIQYLAFHDFVPFGPAMMARVRLKRLTGETGGRFYAGPKGGPAVIFSQIEEELRSMYVVGFRVPAAWRNGEIHKLVIKSKRGGIEVHARQQFAAQVNSATSSQF